MIEHIGKCIVIEEGNEKVLVMGDIHLGFKERLDVAGAMISQKIFYDMIDELENIFKKIGNVSKVVLLGDIKHEFSRIEEHVWKEISELFEYFSEKTDEIVIIKGNHDTFIDVVAAKKNIKNYNYYLWNKYCFLHGDRDFKEIYDKKIGFWIMAHLHPAISLRKGAKEERYKCFLEGNFLDKKVIILPSFLEANEGMDVRNFIEKNEGRKELVWKFNFGEFEVKIVGENFEVLDFGKLKKIK